MKTTTEEIMQAEAVREQNTQYAMEEAQEKGIKKSKKKDESMPKKDEVLRVRVIFTAPILASRPNNPELMADYIASNAPDALSKKEEIEAVGVEGVMEQQMTVFSRDEEDRPFVWDYQWKGFFKDSIGMLRNIPGTESSKIRAYKKWVDGLLFIEGAQMDAIRAEEAQTGLRKDPIARRTAQRRIYLQNTGDLDYCQRPLRASTAMGERQALACSEMYGPGTYMEFNIICKGGLLTDVVYECLDAAEYRGFGQWRNSGVGTFVWDERERESVA